MGEPSYKLITKTQKKMKQITTFATTHQSLGSHNLFHKRVCEAIEQQTPSALKIEAYAPKYKELEAQEDLIVNRPKAQDYTVQLAELDKKRDNAAGVILTVVRAHTTSIIGEKRTAALQLNAALTAYRGVSTNAYRKETAALLGMVRTLKDAMYAPLVTTLGLDDEVEALETANADFDALYVKSEADGAARKELEAIDTRALRTEIDALYQQIVLTVNAFAIAAPTDEINAFIDGVNGAIYRAEQEMGKSHTTGSAPDGGGDDGGESPDPIEPGGGEGDGGESPDPIV